MVARLFMVCICVCACVRALSCLLSCVLVCVCGIAVPGTVQYYGSGTNEIEFESKRRVCAARTLD